MQHVYDSAELQGKVLLSPSAYVVLTGTAVLKVTLLDPFCTRLRASTS